MREERKFYIALLRRFDAALGVFEQPRQLPVRVESLVEIRARENAASRLCLCGVTQGNYLQDPWKREVAYRRKFVTAPKNEPLARPRIN